MIYICNALSLNMLGEDAQLDCKKITNNEAVAKVATADDVTAAIGHADMAAVVSVLLDRDVPVNRINVTLNRGDECLVAQYSGPRLPEGATGLPEGATIQWWLVTVG